MYDQYDENMFATGIILENFTEEIVIHVKFWGLSLTTLMNWCYKFFQNGFNFRDLFLWFPFHHSKWGQLQILL